MSTEKSKIGNQNPQLGMPVMISEILWDTIQNDSDFKEWEKKTVAGETIHCVTCSLFKNIQGAVPVYIPSKFKVDSPNKNHPDYDETFLERLIIEEKELGEKISALNKGLNSDGFAEKVGDYQFELLALQQSTMAAYRRVLNMRIKDLV